MKNKTLITILKALALVISWLTLSPLLLILDGRWKLLPKWLRVVLFLVSPMMVVIIGLAVLFANAAAIDHLHYYHFAKPRVIERITGVSFPEYKYVGNNRHGHGHGPVHYDAELEFDDVPDEAFYKALEKRGDYYIDDNDSVRTFSFKKPYKYLSLDSYYDFITYGDVVIEVKEDSRTFKVTLFEWPGNNGFFKGEDDELRDIEAELAELLAKPCVLVETDSLNIYYPNFSHIDFVTGVMPDKLADTNVVLCCEAAFTGECLTEFKHTNIAGDHVSSGERFRGYRCKRNTGAFVWYENEWKFLWKEYSHELDSAVKHNGMGFGQEMIMHQGKLCETIRKDGNVNQFRALCEVDGKVCVIDSKMSMAFGAFKKQLVAYGVTEALYLDMGPGWNHSWYRDEDGNVIDIYPYQHPYCTNWLTFYR